MYLKDPKTGEQSVSLTMLVSSFVISTIAAVFMFVKTGSTSLLETQLFTFVGLYFGRKLSIKGQSFGVDTTSQEAKKE
ncbi:MAG: hypothetical protein ACOYOV_00090 [Bacteroidales bacterium]